MSEIEIGGNAYRIGRMDAKRQFHVARRLAPLLAGLGGALGTKSEANENDAVSKVFVPLAEALSKMSDEDTDYILDACLDVCQRQSNGQWAPVRARGGLMFHDIDMGQMLQLAVKVVQENLGGFFPGAASA